MRPSKNRELGAPPIQEQPRELPYELVTYEGRQSHRVGLPHHVRLPSCGSVLIGRAPDCEVRIENVSVSRRHAIIHLNQLEVEDIASRNGSALFSDAPSWESVAEAAPGAGRVLEPGRRYTLRPGDFLKIGSVVLTLKRATQPQHTEPVLHEEPLNESEVVVQGAVMRDLYEVAARAAASALPVLILGETGSGKDVLATHIHRSSPRANGPFIRVNCGALSDSLLESELFGHQRGAFTGAGEAKPGMLELGDKGTVFLDEIGELPLHTQVKLLHALETGEVTRVGATRSRAIDVRYVAATNRDLPVEVSEGRFRRDLFFRINAISLDLPPLRQRKSEIEPLARHFLKRFCYSGGIAEPTLSREAVEHLVNHSWPGNVRELRNAVERAVILCRGSEILPRDLPDGKRIAASLRCRPSGIDPWESDTETTVPVWDIGAGLAHLSDSSRVMEAIRLCQGNQTRAAQLLGISRRTLVNRLNEYQLPRPRKRPV